MWDELSDRRCIAERLALAAGEPIFGPVLGVATWKCDFESVRRSAGDPELACVGSGVMEIADQQEVRRFVAAALFLKLDVMDIEASDAAATWHGAGVAIAGEHVLADPLGERGRLARRHVVVERADMLGVAARSFDNFSANLDVVAAAAAPEPYEPSSGASLQLLMSISWSAGS